MKKKTSNYADAVEIRHRAEERLKELTLESDESDPATDDPRRLVHELHVHQIEMEMQNEELQQGRDAMELERKKYSDLYDFAPVGYLTLDYQGTIREINLAGASLLNIERSRLVKRPFGFFTTETGRSVFNQFLHRVFECNGRETCELTLLREGKSSVEVRVEAEASASRQECRAALMDISAFKQAEIDRLILGKLESTGILAGGIAHDFNNLLAVILLNLQLGRALAPTGDELDRNLDAAEKAVLLAGGLTQQLITFAQGGSSIRMPTALPALIRESVGLVLSGSSVKPHYSLPDDIWPSEVDAGQVAQVIRNMVQNAREAMPNGGLIGIQAKNTVLNEHEVQDLPSGKYVLMSIADQGEGIAKEKLANIFDPYFSTKQRSDHKGMGLGLTICHSIIKKHGGRISVESEKGTGTIFHIYLPASRQAIVPEPSAASEAPPRPIRILVMDDEECLRAVLGEILRQLGHDVELVDSGQQAVAKYTSAMEEGNPFDAVILDLTVRAGMGGLATIQKLRQLDPNVKAIAMSGYSTDPVVLEYERHGFKGALAKPFHKNNLQEIISRAMGH